MSSTNKATEQTALARLTTLKGYLEHTPNNLPLLLDAIDTAFAAGKLLEAETLIATATQVAPTSCEIQGHTGYLHMLKGDFTQAAEQLQQALTHGSESIVLSYNLAYSYYRLGKYEQALTVTRTIHQENLPDHGLLKALHVLTARCYYQQYRFTDALNTLAQLPGADAETLGLQSILYCDDQQLDKALAYAEKALRLSPDNQDALIAKASCLLEQAHYDQAHEMFEHIVQLTPDIGRAWAGLGQADFYRLNLEPAIQSFQQAVEYLPKQVDIRLMLAWAYINTQKLKEAAITLDEAIQLDENFVETHEALAALYLLTGETNKAEQHIQTVQKIDPSAKSLDIAKTLLLQQKGDTQNSQKLLETALSEAKDSLNVPLQKMLQKLLHTRVHATKKNVH